jgi:hypothetical protein
MHHIARHMHFFIKHINHTTHVVVKRICIGLSSYLYGCRWPRNRPDESEPILCVYIFLHFLLIRLFLFDTNDKWKQPYIYHPINNVYSLRFGK